MSEAASKEAKKETFLSKVRAEWETKGAKIPEPKEREALMKKYTDAQAVVTAKEGELAAAKTAESDAILALAKAFGCKPLQIGGVVYEFASREEKVFFKRKEAADVIVL